MKKILSKIKNKGVFFWTMFLSFIFTGNVKGEIIIINPIYGYYPTTEDYIIIFSKIGSYIFLFLSIVFMAIFLVFKKKKIAKKWPKVLAVVSVSLSLLLFIISIFSYEIVSFFEYLWFDVILRV